MRFTIPSRPLNRSSRAPNVPNAPNVRQLAAAVFSTA